MALGLADGVLALAEGVPQLDCLVTGARHNLQANNRQVKDLIQGWSKDPTTNRH